MVNEMVEAVIFDMDGVLINSEIYYANYRKDFFKMKKIDTRHLNDSDFIGANIKNITNDTKSRKVSLNGTQYEAKNSCWRKGVASVYTDQHPR